MPDDIYAGLPREFHPPHRTAARIAQFGTLAERSALVERIPVGWQELIAHQARIDIALAICELPEREDRLVALAEVPEPWLDEVRWHVTRLWRTRALRAQYREEQAAKRETRAA